MKRGILRCAAGGLEGGGAAVWRSALPPGWDGGCETGFKCRLQEYL